MRKISFQDACLDFSMQWLHDMEENRVREFDSIIKQAEKELI